MVSDKRSGAQGGNGAGRGPRMVGIRPGSINRSFVSTDPERQREPDVGGGSAADEAGRSPRDRGRRLPAGGVPAPPKGGRRGDAEAGTDDEGGSA